MHETDSDKDWERLGKTDPYWAVITHDRFRRENLDNQSMEDFFASGEQYIAWVLETIHAHLDATFLPSRALDFGCGVGRLVLPLARTCESVVGVDVSESMLREAHAHAGVQQLTNVWLVKSDDQLSEVAGSFDLINSYIVFQHIPCNRGQKLLRRLIELLNEGGVGVIHLTYSKAIFDADPFSAWPSSAAMFSTTPIEGLRYYLSVLRRTVPRQVRKLLPRAAGSNKPVMQMNPYTLNPLFHILQLSGIRRMHVELTDHEGEYGVILFFQKAHDRSYRA